MKRLTPQDLPPGVTTTASMRPDGSRVYIFTHKRLGTLGNFVIKAHGPTQTKCSAEIPPGDPDTPEWEERFVLMDQIATTCMNALSKGEETKPLPTMEVVREQRRLFRRFIATSHSIEMFGLAKQLSAREYTVLFQAIEDALQTASRTDALGIRQRREELTFYMAQYARTGSQATRRLY